MFIRLVKGSSKEYALIVRSYRDKSGKPKQETVYNLGSVNDANREQMVNFGKRLIASLQGGQIITKGEDIVECSRHNWGAAAVINELWQRFALDEQFKGMHSKVTAIKLMLADRLLTPSSKLATFNKRNKYEDFQEATLHEMYRSLDFLADHQDAIKSHLFKKQKLRSSLDVVFFDVTTLYFESKKVDNLRDFGYSKDCKFNEVQVVLCLIIDKEGHPLSYELFAGNTFEGATLLPILQRLQQEFQINKLIIVADRGIGSAANLAAVKAAGFHYIIGAKLRSAAKNIQTQAIEPEGFCSLSKHSNEDQCTYKFIKNKQQSWVVLHSSKRARKDQADRQRLIERAAEMLKKGSSLNAKRGAKKFIKSSKESKDNCCLDIDKINNDARFDGFYAISFSDETLSAADISAAYHGLWQIEESFRTMKSFFEIRPIFHWTAKRIQGHILLNFILLVMENFLLHAAKHQVKAEVSHERLRSALNLLEYSILQIDSHNFTSYAPVDDYQAAILLALNIPIPKNHKI